MSSKENFVAKLISKNIIPIAVTWILAAATGFACLMQYSGEALATREVPHTFPEDVCFASFRDEASSAKLICFIHPFCSCSMATLRELEKLLANEHSVAVAIVFSAEELQWKVEESSLWPIAQRIPQVNLIRDDSGTVRRQFGASVSGETFLFGDTNRLLFHGGITGSRGHEGACRGGELLAERLMDFGMPREQSPVFGCSLINDENN